VIRCSRFLPSVDQTSARSSRSDMATSRCSGAPAQGRPVFGQVWSKTIGRISSVWGCRKALGTVLPAAAQGGHAEDGADMSASSPARFHPPWPAPTVVVGQSECDLDHLLDIVRRQPQLSLRLVQLVPQPLDLLAEVPART